MVMVNMFGQMGDDIKDNGKIIKCMEKGNLNGLMEKNILENMLKIRNKAMENFIMEKERNVIKVNGKMEINKDLDNSQNKME